MTPKKRLFSLLLSLLITFSLLSAGLPAASAAADHTPKNIKVKITGVEKDASGKEVLVTEGPGTGMTISAILRFIRCCRKPPRTTAFT